MQLLDALNVSEKSIVSLIGGGGKTTTMFALGREAKERGLKTVLTTTTRIFCPDNRELVIVTGNAQALLSGVRNELASHSIVVAGAELAPEGKLAGLDPMLAQDLLDAGADLVVVEADGAARKPFKAPAAHEPVIPEASTLIVPVVGIDCLNKPLLPEHIHRPEIVSALSGIKAGDPVTPEVVARVLTHPLGFRKGLPADCRWIPLINKVETGRELEEARKIAALVGKIIPCRVVVGASAHDTPVLEILDFNRL